MPISANELRSQSLVPPHEKRRSLYQHYMQLLASVRRPVGAERVVPRVVGLTSCGHGEGVSTVASNLATVAAQTIDGRVIIVDCNTSFPAIDRLLRVPLAPGLGDYLAGSIELRECLYQGSFEHLTVVPIGSSQNRLAVLRDTDRLAELLQLLQHDFSLIIVDLSPIDELNHCLPIVKHLDGVLLVVASEQVDAGRAQNAVTRLHQSGANLLGAVLNNQRQYLPGWLDRKQ